MFSEVAEIALIAARLRQFQQLPKTRVILILNFTQPHVITYTNQALYIMQVKSDHRSKFSNLSNWKEEA